MILVVMYSFILLFLNLGALPFLAFGFGDKRISMLLSRLEVDDTPTTFLIDGTRFAVLSKEIAPDMAADPAGFFFLFV